MQGGRWIAALLVLALAGVAGGQDDPLRMQEITVQASPIDPYLPARTEIDRDEIIDSRKSELSEVIELTPGINVRQGGRGEVRVDMRGFDQRAILFTLNGVPVYEPYNGIINVDLFPLEMLGGIDIARGASSSLYGPNGMAGQIKLNTFGITQPLRGAAQAIWRDADFWDLRASGGGIREGLSVVGAGSYLTSPNFPLSEEFSERPPSQQRGEDGGARQNSDLERGSGFLSLGYEYGDGGRAHLAVVGTETTFGIPPSTTQFAPFHRRVDPQQLLHAQAGVDQRVAPTVGVTGGVFATVYDSRELEYPDATYTDPYLRTDTASHEVGGIGRVTIDIGSCDSLAIGGLLRGDGARVADSARGTRSDSDLVIGSVAAENVYSVTDRVSVILGLSYDLKSGAGVGTTGEVDPQGVLFVDWTPWGSTRLSIGRKIRFPTLRELYDPLQGNPGLKPEATLTYEIGHQVSRDWGYASLNLFRSDVSDLIEAGGSSGDPLEFSNLQSATLQGVEVATGVEPFAWMRLDVNYTYLDTAASDVVILGNAESAIQHKPANRFNGILQLFLPWRFLFRTEGIYTSQQLDQFGSDVFVGGFGLWNVQLSRPLLPWLTAFAGCDNLLDADWEQKLGTPEAGRRAFVGVRASY
ncbi:MAG TPA: TonB-dependent receptor [Candidatus Dormibacteraeota bacterium]|nr:TonB-dependent receptor [Candidatus Dormibacteraeota bacterium]